MNNLVQKGQQPNNQLTNPTEIGCKKSETKKSNKNDSNNPNNILIFPQPRRPEGKTPKTKAFPKNGRKVKQEKRTK